MNTEEGFIVDASGIVEGHVECFELQALRISEGFRKNNPRFASFFSEVVTKVGQFEREGNIPFYLHSDHSITQMLWHVNSLKYTCLNILYSIERLDVLATWNTTSGSSSLLSTIILYYFTGFLSGVKTATDVLALMVNHLFQLGIEDKRCRIDKGIVAMRLIAKHESPHAKQLSLILERDRNDWIADFYAVRNAVTHRADMFCSFMPIRFVEEQQPSHPFSVFPSPHDSTLINLTRKVAPSSLVFDNSLDPTLFCSEVWSKLSLLIDSVSVASSQQLEAAISLYSA